MKIYGRTLLFFIGAITFQALLTAGLIIGLVSRNNQAVTRQELKEEFAQVYQNYNSWVRMMWKTSIQIRNNELLQALTVKEETWNANNRFFRTLEKELLNTGIDSFIVRRGRWNHFEVLIDAYPFIDDFSGLEIDRDHPYIALKLIEDNVFLVASFTLNDSYEIYLLKNIDEDFCDNLTTRDHAKVFISQNRGIIWDSIGNGEDYSSKIGLDEQFPPYSEYYDLNFGKGHYHVSVRNIGEIEKLGPVKLLVFMSVEPYFSLLIRIGRIVLLVSLITAVLTALVSLLFTMRLTRPIQNMAMAIREIQDGNWSVSVPEKAMGEIRQLMQGFNEMVSHLRENQITLDANLREIIFLKEYNETIIHSLRAGILVVDDCLRIEKSNSVFNECFLSRNESPEGQDLESIAPAILDTEILNAARSIAKGRDSTWNGVRRDGEVIWDVKVYPLVENRDSSRGKSVIEFDDISVKIDLEQKIIQAEKLSSISLLSAGIAHEINNPLSTILSNAQMLMSRTSDDFDKESLRWINRETRRIANIINDLRDFSNSDDDGSSIPDVRECIEEVVRLVRYGIPKDSKIRIVLKSPEEALTVAVPRNVLHQSILNILQNAVQAVGDSGEIVIETMNIDALYQGIRISDNGSGIPEEIRDRIFDPFYTTKKKGVGTGLGLSIVYGIMKKIGGDIEVKSPLGKGAEFTLILPIDRNT